MPHMNYPLHTCSYTTVADASKDVRKCQALRENFMSTIVLKSVFGGPNTGREMVNRHHCGTFTRLPLKYTFCRALENEPETKEAVRIHYAKPSAGDVARRSKNIRKNVSKDLDTACYPLVARAYRGLKWRIGRPDPTVDSPRVQRDHCTLGTCAPRCSLGCSRGRRALVFWCGWRISTARVCGLG